MAHYKTYECDQCFGRFRWMHHPSDSPPPSECPLCGVANDPQPSFIPQAPAIKGVAAAAGDQVYRSMEAASANRAEMMAELGGGSASDYSHTKITDLKDNQREGDTGFKMPVSARELRGYMTQTPVTQASGHVHQAQEFAKQAHTGYMPHAGAGASEVVSKHHANMVARMRSMGQMNSKGQ